MATRYASWLIIYSCQFEKSKERLAYLIKQPQAKTGNSGTTAIDCHAVPSMRNEDYPELHRKPCPPYATKQSHSAATCDSD